MASYQAKSIILGPFRHLLSHAVACGEARTFGNYCIWGFTASSLLFLLIPGLGIFIPEIKHRGTLLFWFKDAHCWIIGFSQFAHTNACIKRTQSVHLLMVSLGGVAKQNTHIPYHRLCLYIRFPTVTCSGDDARKVVPSQTLFYENMVAH